MARSKKCHERLASRGDQGGAERDAIKYKKLIYILFWLYEIIDFWEVQVGSWR